MTFKGGTSLSKAYHLIQRFSEDIDVVTAVEFFLERGVPDPQAAPNPTQRQKRMDALDEACANYIAGPLLTELRGQFERKLRSSTGWDLSIDPDDKYRHTVLFRYPTSAPELKHSYIRERVKIELGWRSVTKPATERTFQSYIAHQFPDLIADPMVRCNVLTPERTFWEKVTALHAENHRDTVPRNFSRHYSDVATMFQTEVGMRASKDLAMLEDVRQFKSDYYLTKWARYDLAIPGSLRVVPSEVKARELAADYQTMRVMFFRDPPPFADVLRQLDVLQSQVNG